MKTAIFIIAAMLPLLAACTPAMTQQKTTTTTSANVSSARSAPPRSESCMRYVRSAMVAHAGGAPVQSRRPRCGSLPYVQSAVADPIFSASVGIQCVAAVPGGGFSTIRSMRFEEST